MAEPQRTLLIEKQDVAQALQGQLVAGVVRLSNENATQDVSLVVGNVAFVDGDIFKIPLTATMTVGVSSGGGLVFTTVVLALGQTLGVAGTGGLVLITLLTNGVEVVGAAGDKATLRNVGNTVTMADGTLVELSARTYSTGREVQLLLTPSGLYVDFVELLSLGEDFVTQRGILITFDEEQRSPLAAELGYEFDAVLSFSQEQRIELTKHPLEDGARIVDHTIVNPRTYHLNAVVTNTPLNAPASTAGGVAPNTPRRAEIFLANLQALQRSRALLAVVHPQIVPREEARGDGQALISAAQAGTYIITGLTSTDTPEVGESVEMNIELEEVVTVSSKTSTLPKGLLARKDTGKNKGKTDTSAATDQEAQATTFGLDLFTARTTFQTPAVLFR